MQRKNPQSKQRKARKEATAVKGYVVHWTDPNQPGVIQFHPEFLPFASATQLGRALSMAGLPALVSPVVCRDIRKHLSKNAGKQQASPTPMVLKLDDRPAT